MGNKETFICEKFELVHKDMVSVIWIAFIFIILTCVLSFVVGRSKMKKYINIDRKRE